MNQPDEKTSRKFGSTRLGEPVTLFTLTNASGTSVSVMDYGATIVNLHTRDRVGLLRDIVLGYDEFETYLEGPYYFGCIAGRFANRISRGYFEIDGKGVQLATNDGPNALHGGVAGFDKQLWTGEGQGTAVRFHLLSPAGQEGYPGALRVAVTYTLTPENALHIDYEATTDETTVLNLTNHSYFNLAGEGSGSIVDHWMKIPADAITEVDAAAIPTGILAPVKGSRFDFNSFTRIGERFEINAEQSNGYDYNYVLRKSAGTGEPELAAEVYEEKSGRWMKVYTDQPGMQFYTGGFLRSEPAGKSGHIYPRHTGFCLETQHFPDSPNQPHFPSTILRPSEVFQSRTTYAFGTREVGAPTNPNPQ